MWHNNAFLKEELEQVDKYLSRILKTKNKSVEAALEAFLKSGGKRLRPALAILGATFGNYDRDIAVRVAAAMEIMHMATLIHDDIIDDAKLRRGKETIQSRLGKDIAVYVGDFLFTRAFMAMADLAEIDMIKQASKAVAFICDSEISQNEQRYDKKITTKMYLKRVGGKTAALFALSIAVGAHKAGCPPKLVNKLARVGKNIGMAFQIVDDILDFEGEQEVVGKPLLSDALQGIYTIPIIYAMDTEYKDEVCAALDYLEKDKTVELSQLIIISGGLDKAKRLAKKYIDKALKGAYMLPDGIGKEVILDIIHNQLERKF